MTESYTAGKLRELLADLPDDMVVLMARDPEGNGFGAYDEMTDGYYVTETGRHNPVGIDQTWPRYGPEDDITDVDPEDLAPEDAQPCVILWPTD